MSADARHVAGPARRGKNVLIAMAAVAAAPVVLAWLFYYLFPRDSRTNYGELLPTRPIAAVSGTREDGTPFRISDVAGRWAILIAAPGSCPPACERMLYATRQARTLQNADQERVVRVWLLTDAVSPAADLLAQHPGLVVIARVPQADVRALPRGPERIYLVDPLGNQVLAWPVDPDIKAVARDLSRLLKASRIG